jgi:phosphoribosylamine--glycine ligase/phosphoribosylformylglycinamidine cyclo-ligase
MVSPYRVDRPPPLNIAPVGIPFFGPNVLAAKMEGSKAFAKDFMMRHGIPTAKFKVFGTNQHENACDYIKACGHPVVLKASGLAAGKGVLIPASQEEALVLLKQIMVDRAFGSAGSSSEKNCVDFPLNSYPRRK